MISSELSRWLSNNTTSIERCLQNQIPKVYSKRPTNLLLSDLRLCHGVSSMYKPLGFELKIGSYISRDDYSPIYHEAHMSDTGTIIEYVPGQFFANESKGISGKTQLLSIASHVVLELSNEVFVAVGQKSKLESLLDIIYFL